jgi:hypothetical protein
MFQSSVTREDKNQADGDRIRRVVYVRLQGGLGNQLFQYAAARNLAVLNEADLRMDTSAFGRRSKRRFELDGFQVTAARAGTLERLRLRLDLRRERGRALHVKEPYFHYWPGLAQLRSPLVVLDGYWQSEKYFSAIGSHIRSEISLRQSIDPGAQHLSTMMQATEAVAVHVRRGDYATDPVVKRIHPVLPIAYYQEALHYLLDHGVKPSLFIFSDDPAWCRAHLRFPAYSCLYVADHGVTSVAQELELMRRCRHHIIANSSLSWWGAWLAEHPGQIVVAPRRWFSAPDRDVRDLIPHRWKLI